MTTRGFDKHARGTRKAEFLVRMERLMPWAQLCALIEPYYPKAGNGRPPVGLERMLRMYCLANWFNLGDVAGEEALHDLPLFRDFCGVDLGDERIPDGSTLGLFRNLLEKHDLGQAIFAKVGELLQANGLRLSGGTIVDATLIAAPPSVKNRDKARNLVERFFNRLKQFRRLATRYDKLTNRFNAFLHLARAYIWLL